MKFVILHEGTEQDIYSITFDVTRNEYIGLMWVKDNIPNSGRTGISITYRSYSIPGVIAGLVDLLDEKV